MLKPFGIVVAMVLATVAAKAATAKQVRLLDGRLSFNTPVDVSHSTHPAKHSERYSALLDATSADGGFSVLVTYGQHTVAKPDIAEFMREKVASYTSRSSNLPHFRWIDHRITERDGQQWADICFSHDNDTGAHVYTRCLSCFVDGRLLEIWALTRRAGDSTQKAYVGRLVDSIHFRS